MAAGFSAPANVAPAGRGLTFAEGEKNLHAIACAGGHVWAGCCTSPSLLLKVDPGLAGYERIEFQQASGLHDIVFDRGVLWVAHASGHLSRVDPRTGEFETCKLSVSSRERPFLYAAASGRQGIWMGTYTDPGRLLRIDRETMAQQEFVIPEARMCSVRGLAFDRARIWAALYDAPGMLVTLDPQTGRQRIIDLGEENMLPTSMEFDGVHMWAGLDTRPAKVVRVNVDTGEFSPYTLRAGSSCVRGLVSAGGHLWAGLYTEPGELVRLDPRTKEFDTFAMPDEFFNVRDLAFDGTHVWAGLQNVRYEPSAVYRVPVDVEPPRS